MHFGHENLRAVLVVSFFTGGWYQFSSWLKGYQLITYHLFEEDLTKVRIFKGNDEEYSPEIFEWDRSEDLLPDGI